MIKGEEKTFFHQPFQRDGGRCKPLGAGERAASIEVLCGPHALLRIPGVSGIRAGADISLTAKSRNLGGTAGLSVPLG